MHVKWFGWLENWDIICRASSGITSYVILSDITNSTKMVIVVTVGFRLLCVCPGISVNTGELVWKVERETQQTAWCITQHDHKSLTLIRSFRSLCTDTAINFIGTNRLTLLFFSDMCLGTCMSLHLEILFLMELLILSMKYKFFIMMYYVYHVQ